MRLSPHALSHLMATALLALSSLPASAALITYSFTGATQGSYQQNSSYTTNSDGSISYTPTYGSCSDCASGSVSFTVDASRYTDAYTGINGYTYNYTGNSAAPWISSQGSVSGPNVNRALATPGNALSYLHSYNNAYSGGEGYFHAFDYAIYDTGSSTFDDQGRLVSSSYDYSYNNAFLTGDVTLASIDGQELPVGLSNWSNSSYFYQYTYSYEYLYSYDEQGIQTSLLTDYVYEYTYLPIAAIRITRSDEPVNGVPEPGSLALLGLGGALLAWRSRRRT